MQINLLGFILLFTILAHPLLSLELKKETVILQVQKHYHVQVTVEFEMEGILDKKLVMAFPETDELELFNFQVEWDDKRMKVSKHFAGKNRSYNIGTLQLPAIFKFSVPPSTDTKHNLKTSYKYKAPAMSGTKSPKGYYLEYILQTGSKWDDNIGEVVFLIKGKNRICERIFVLNDSYEGVCNQQGDYYVRLKNIEPRKDFRYILMELTDSTS